MVGARALVLCAVSGILAAVPLTAQRAKKPPKPPPAPAPQPPAPGAPTTSAQQDLAPTGRVCAAKSFGNNATKAGKVEPVWFQNPGAIALGSDGNLYSTSPSGGKHLGGTVFSISPSGQLTVLHDFRKFDPTDGSGPTSGLVDGGDGYFYGTTYAGGHFGVGTIFRIKQGQNAIEILWNFRNGSTLGMLPDCANHRCPFTGRQRADISAAYPMAPPVVAPGGTLYGVTPYSNNQQGGVLYTTSPPYDSTRFHAMCIFDQRLLADTAMKPFVCKAKITEPYTLIRAASGALYGTTLGGNGTIFKATTSGTGDVTTIHEFNLTEGSKPFNLLLASNGRLYGTTAFGTPAGLGIIYGMDTDGSNFTVMSAFHVNAWRQGATPFGALVEAKPRGSVDTFLFGTTRFGGRYGRGTIFRIPLTGDSLALREVVDFDMGGTGRSPLSAMTAGPKNLLYGLTYEGGAYGGGVFYTFDPIVLQDAPTHDSDIRGGQPAKDDNGKLLSDPIVAVRVNANAIQAGVGPTGPVLVNNSVGGIWVRGACPNAHIVQFVYRERLSPANVALPGQMSPSSGNYPLTTSASNIQWHTDTPGRPLPPLQQRNAYLDQGIGAIHASSPSWVAIFDNPNFPAPAYPPSGQTATAKTSELWRITARDFLVCNCQVTKEIWWAREEKAGKLTFAHMKILKPAANALSWINTQLQKDGYATIP